MLREVRAHHTVAGLALVVLQEAKDPGADFGHLALFSEALTDPTGVCSAVHIGRCVPVLRLEGSIVVDLHGCSASGDLLLSENGAFAVVVDCLERHESSVPLI